MASLSANGKRLLVIGAILFAIQEAGLTVGFDAPLRALAPIAAIWWLPVVAGVGLLVLSRYGGAATGSLPGLGGGIEIERQDIISATDWSRIGTHLLRRSYGVGLAVSALVALIVSLALQEYSLVALWLGATIIGAIVVALTWRAANEISDEYTETITVRSPDNFALHSFHIALRQTAEDLGYAITTNVSPTEGGRPSAAAEDVFHADGGFKARNRPIDESRSLAPELDDVPFGSILTVATLGVFVTVLGSTLVSADVGGGAVTALGAILVLVGAVVLAYDYATRTHEWAELACVEEGTVYPVTVNEYADEVYDSFSSPKLEPNASTTETSVVLSVTVSAKSTPLYDADRVEEDFEALAEAVREAATDYRFDASGGRRALSYDEGASADPESAEAN